MIINFRIPVFDRVLCLYKMFRTSDDSVVVPEQGSGNISAERVSRMEELENREDCEISSSGPCQTLQSRTLNKLGMIGWDLHKTRQHQHQQPGGISVGNQAASASAARQHQQQHQQPGSRSNSISSQAAAATRQQQPGKRDLVKGARKGRGVIAFSSVPAGDPLRLQQSVPQMALMK